MHRANTRQICEIGDDAERRRTGPDKEAHLNDDRARTRAVFAFRGLRGSRRRKENDNYESIINNSFFFEARNSNYL